MNGDIKIRAERRVFSDDVELLVLERHGAAEYSVGVSVTMERLERGAAATQPTLTLTNTQAQELMDNLWQCGLRPSEGTGSAGALSATQRHLEDMRKLVFKGE